MGGRGFGIDCALGPYTTLDPNNLSFNGTLVLKKGRKQVYKTFSKNV